MSVVAICNQAISWLGGNLITALTDDSTEAQLCSANYEELRDVVLEDRAWTFAQKWYRMTPTSNTPINAARWTYQFLLDPEVLRVNEVVDENDNPITYVKEERYLYSNQAVLIMRGNIKVIDPTKFSAGFRQALATRIAADIALPLTQSRTLQQDMYKLYGQKLLDGVATDGMQGTPRRVRSNWTRRVR